MMDKRSGLLAVVLLVFALCGCEAPEYEYCEWCGDDVESVISTGWETFCPDCFLKVGGSVCVFCEVPYVRDDWGVDTLYGYCWDCTEKFVWWCSGCEDAFPVASMVEIAEGYFLCGSCTLHRLNELGYDGTVDWILRDSPLIPRE